MLSPLVLSSAVTLAQNENKDVLVQARLASPLKTPMWLEEIIFSIASSSLQQNVSTSVYSQDNYGGSVFADIQMDRAKITNNFVPVWLFGKLLNDSQAGNPPCFSDVQGVYTWKLPKPMWVDPDSNLRVSLRRAAEGSIGSVTCRVTLIGHAVSSTEPRPHKICVPWVSAYLATQVLANADATDQSDETELVNPFDVPVRVQRMIGRIKYIDTAFANPRETTVGLHPVGAPSASGLYTLVRVFDQHGRIIVRDYTPFGLLFCQTDRSWTMDAQLEPKGFYKVLLDQKYSSVGLATKYLQPQISVVGYRELEF
jgi:hypothetical protein